MKKITLAGLAVLFLAGCSVNDKFNGWLDDCEDAGGITSLVEIHDGFWGRSESYQCYVDGEKVDLG